jgi:probable rRNA maturation factor
VITDAQGRPVASGGVGRWLERAAPPTARGLVSIALVDDRVSRRLNRVHRGKDVATDVLSFQNSPGHRDEASGPRTVLGDLDIATDVARRQAREHGHALNTELRILALHGLHLLGYDHGRTMAGWRGRRRG